MNKTAAYILIIFLLQGCTTPAEIFITKEFETNIRSSSISLHSFSSEKIELLGYRQLTDSIYEMRQSDSLINIGLLFPAQTVRKEMYSHIFLFGTDSQQCLVKYKGVVQSLLTKPPAIKPPGNVPAQQEENRITGVQLNGTVQFFGSNTSFSFSYNNHKGWLLMYADSFKLQPIYQAAGKSLQTLVGVQLQNNNLVYAAVYSFTGLSKKKAFIYTKATPDEQLLIAAYIAVIARYL